MTLQELIALYRAEVLDMTEPYFSSDELLTIYANEAQDEACRRGKLLVDSDDAMCVIPYLSGSASVPLDSRIVNIERARIGGWMIATVDVKQMDAGVPYWQESEGRGVPTRLVLGLTNDRAYFWPRPADDGVLRLTVQRLALQRMASMSDQPEIRQEAHPALVEWMKYRTYTRQDSELFNQQQATVALGNFEAEFGRKASVRNEEWVRCGVGLMPGPIA